VHVVGRAVIGVTLLLPIFGAIAYHRAISGRTSWVPFVSALFAYNGALLRGFLNFNLSVAWHCCLAPPGPHGGIDALY